MINEQLHPVPVGEAFEVVGIDIVGPVTAREAGHKYIIITINYLIKWAEAHPLIFADQIEITQFVYEDIISRHGCPCTIISDNGTHFDNSFMSSICDKFRIKHRFSSPYHPQTNGLIEWLNQTLMKSLQ